MTTKAREHAHKTEKKRLVKYMGSSHIRVIPKGDKLGGELVEGVPSEVEWDIDNHHIAEMPDDWSEVQIQTLCEYDDGQEFLEVTNEERVPPSLGQQLFRAAKPRTKLDAVNPDLPGVVTTLQDSPPSGAEVGGGQTTTADPASSTG